MLVRSFVASRGPGATQFRRRIRHCLAASSARLSPAPTQAPLPEFSVLNTCRPRQAPRTTAAPELLPGLAAISNRRSRRYEENPPRDEHWRRPGSRRRLVYAPQRTRFPQAEARSARVPSTFIVRNSAPSPPSFPTSAFAPFMVELFVVGCFVRSPTGGQAYRVDSSRSSTLPTSARLSEPVGPNPLGRSPLHASVLRRLAQNAAACFPSERDQACLRRPASTTTVYRIEPGDWATR